MVKIAICEDNEEDFKVISNLLKLYSEKNNSDIQINRFNNGLSFLCKYDFSYDILFMDIILGDINGIETCKMLRKKDSEIIIVFVTNMSNLAMEGYEVNASDFLVKPISYWNLSLLLDKLFSIQLESKEKKLIVYENEKKVCISIFQIIMVEVYDHLLVFYSKDSKYTLNGSLKDMEASIGKYGFCLTNNSVLVNLRYVISVQKDCVLLSYNLKAPINKRRKKHFLLSLTEFVGGVK